MPTSRPRYQITATSDVEHALAAASRRWPDEPRSRLLVLLVLAGGAAIERSEDEALARVTEAVAAASGKYAGVFDETHLADLRQDWPE